MSRAYLTRDVRRRQARVSMKGELAQLQHTLELKDAQILYERNQRVQAQRGLVVYVRALESFNKWLVEHPSPELEAVLKAHGLHGISLGYDPDQDPEIIANGV